MNQSLSLDSKYSQKQGSVYMTGVQALVRLLIEQSAADERAGLKTASLVTGYQGSPLAGLDLELERHAQRMESARVRHQPALNEELAATAILGSQLTASLPGAIYEGLIGYWYGKSPGLDRAADAIRHANLIGVEPLGGAIAIVGDDAMSKSSTLPSSSESAFFDLLVPFVSPADPQEVIELGRHAVALSRASGLWAGMKIPTNVADGSATVDLDRVRINPIIPTVELDGKPYRHRPTSKLAGAVQLELERSLHSARLEAAKRYGVENNLNRILFDAPGDRIGIIASGKTYLDLLQTLRQFGLTEEEIESSPIRLLKISMPFPLDRGTVRDFAAGLDEVVVLEEKRAFLELFVKESLYGADSQPAVYGKHTPEGVPLVPADRELDPDRIRSCLAERLGPFGIEVAQPNPTLALTPSPVTSGLPVRTPWFCSGCPHNSSTKVPEGTLVGAGIGCHGMVLLMPAESVGEVSGLTQMGGEGAQWIGMAPFTSREHFVQNVGDGTFFHSGSLGIRAAVAADVNMTFKILLNSAVAMTGGQQAVGGKGIAELTNLLAAEGVVRTVVTSDDVSRLRGIKLASNAELRPRKQIVEAQELLAETPGVTVLIHDQECAAELRRKRKRGKAPVPANRVMINERVCEGCGDCGRKSSCLSVQPVETEFGQKTRIHQASCNMDYSCLEGDCPSFLTVVGGSSAKKAQSRIPRAGSSITAADLREPVVSTSLPASIRIVGVGGTGVVTVAQILGTAALLDGLAVRGLDQTGLAQKGGTVVSDLRIFAESTPEGNKVAEGEADLYLGCDLIAASAAQNLRVASVKRTRAVISTADVPTGSMVVGAAPSLPDSGAPRQAIDLTSRPGNHYLDSQSLTRQLFGGDQTSNILLLGVAYQDGTIPVASEAIEEAIELNGANVEQNLQAFRRGRQWAADPEGLEAALGQAIDPGSRSGEAVLSDKDEELIALTGAQAGSELDRVLRIRVPDLVSYQNRRYAREYSDFVGNVRKSEHSAVGSDELATTVAVNLYKLMTYKDEYEVARLHLDPEFRAGIERDFGAGSRTYWHLHPPLLRSLGLKRKWKVGGWFRSTFRVLRLMRGLRFTPFDPFGWAHVRRVERDLIEEYRDLIGQLIGRIDGSNHAALVEIAGLPDMVRGYETIKIENVERYRERKAELLALMEETDVLKVENNGRVE